MSKELIIETHKEEGIIHKGLFSPDKRYQYLTERSWFNSNATKEWPLVFMLLNPSMRSKPSQFSILNKIKSISSYHGHSDFLLLNLFALKANKPSELKDVKDPIGPENNKVIKLISNISDVTVCAWGNNGQIGGRSKEVLGMIDNPVALQFNKSGEPRYPMNIAYDESFKPINK